jgi:hypothetical protein
MIMGSGWKTAFYKVEGWDPKTGYPARKTLEDLGLKHVADVLAARTSGFVGQFEIQVPESDMGRRSV